MFSVVLVCLSVCVLYVLPSDYLNKWSLLFFPEPKNNRSGLRVDPEYYPDPRSGNVVYIQVLVFIGLV